MPSYDDVPNESPTMETKVYTIIRIKSGSECVETEAIVDDYGGIVYPPISQAKMSMNAVRRHIYVLTHLLGEAEKNIMRSSMEAALDP